MINGELLPPGVLGRYQGISPFCSVSAIDKRTSWRTRRVPQGATAARATAAASGMVLTQHPRRQLECLPSELANSLSA